MWKLVVAVAFAVFASWLSLESLLNGVYWYLVVYLEVTGLLAAVGIYYLLSLLKKA